MLLVSRCLCHASQNVTERLHPPVRLQREPILRPEHPWEARGVYFQGSVLKDGDTFRMWYSAIGQKRREEQYCGYAESRDGLHWEKPLSRERPCREWPETNVVYGQNFNIAAPNVHFYAQPRGGHRFFMSFDSRIEQHQFQFVPKVGGLTEADKRRYMRHPNYTPDFDWRKFWPNDQQTYRALYFADSTDGLRWEPVDARFGIAGMSDGDHTVAWDPAARLYRIYFRDNRIDDNGARIRQVVTATSPDTVEWSAPRLCLESDAIDDPRVNQIHGMTVTQRDGVFIGLIQMMEIHQEAVAWNPLTPFEFARFHVQLAVSADGVRFHRVGERGEFFGTSGQEGTFDYGMVRCGGQWVFDGDRMLMYFDGRPYEHGQSDKQRAAGGDGLSTDVGIGVAESPMDRFAGLTPLDASRPGHVVVALPEGARALALNCEVPEGAQITASLRRPDGCRVLTHTDDLCLPIRRSALRAPLQWKGQSALPQDIGPLHVRLRLTGAATAYAIYPERQL